MVSLSPGDANLLVARAQAYARIGQADVALADLRSPEAADPHREYAWLNVAGAAYGARQYQAAIDIASAGLDAHSASTGLLMQRGVAQLSLGDLASAVKDFDAAIQLDKTLPAAYHWKGRAQIAQGNYTQAAETLKQGAELGVKSGVKDVNLAYESMAFAADAMARDNVNAAFSYLAENVINYGSRDPLLMGYGLVRWRQGSIDQALTRMDALVRSGYTPALYWRGAIHADQGDRGNAMLDLKYFLGVEHSGPDVESARAILKSLDVDPDAGTPAP
jgi:tetratricopeptide (TPR) repeat protein